MKLTIAEIDLRFLKSTTLLSVVCLFLALLSSLILPQAFARTQETGKPVDIITVLEAQEELEHWDEQARLELARFLVGLTDEEKENTESRMRGYLRTVKGKVQEISGFIDFVAMFVQNENIHFASDNQLVKLNKGNRPDGLAYSIEEDLLIVHGIFESKAGAARLNENQVRAFIRNVKLNGLTVREGNFSSVALSIDGEIVPWSNLLGSQSLGSSFFLCSPNPPASFQGIVVSPNFSEEQLTEIATKIITSDFSTIDEEVLERLFEEDIKILADQIRSLEDFLSTFQRWPQANGKSVIEHIIRSDHLSIQDLRGFDQKELTNLVQRLGGRERVFQILTPEIADLPYIKAFAMPRQFIDEFAAGQIQRTKENIEAFLEVSKIHDPTLFIAESLVASDPSELLISQAVIGMVDRRGGWLKALKDIPEQYREHIAIQMLLRPSHYFSSATEDKVSYSLFYEISRMVELLEATEEVESWIRRNNRAPRQIGYETDEEKQMHRLLVGPAQLNFVPLMQLGKSLSEGNVTHSSRCVEALEQ